MSTVSRREFTATMVGAALPLRATLEAAATRAAQPGSAKAAPSTGASDALAALTLAEASARLRGGTVVVGRSRQRVSGADRRLQPEDQRLHHRDARAALAQAKALDAEQRAGKLRGPLHGIPIALKDNIDTAGVRTTAASAVFDDRVPAEDAEVARRLSAAGAVVIGKGQSPRVRLRRHVGDELLRAGAKPVGARAQSRADRPADRPRRSPTDLCYGALGTDTGGSIRTPASYCSIVG